MMDGSTLGAVPPQLRLRAAPFRSWGRETSCESVIEDGEEEGRLSRFSSSDRGDGRRKLRHIVGRLRG